MNSFYNSSRFEIWFCCGKEKLLNAHALLVFFFQRFVSIKYFEDGFTEVCIKSVCVHYSTKKHGANK